MKHPLEPNPVLVTIWAQQRLQFVNVEVESISAVADSGEWPVRFKHHRSIFTFGLWSLLFCVNSAAWAQDTVSAKEVAPGIKSGDVELGLSRVYVKVGKVGLGHEHAASGKIKSGSLHLDKPDASGSFGTLVFDMTTFEADSESARAYIGLPGKTDDDTKKKVNENMLGKEVMDVAKYPTATFEAKKSASSTNSANAACPSTNSKATSLYTARPNRSNSRLMLNK